MHYILMCRSMTTAQKAVRVLQNAGIFASAAKAPQSANPGGCTYGAKVAARNLNSAMAQLERAGITVLKVIEVNGTSSREVRP